MVFNGTKNGVNKLNSQNCLWHMRLYFSLLNYDEWLYRMKSVTHRSSMVETLSMVLELHEMYMWLFWTSIAGFSLCWECNALVNVFFGNALDIEKHTSRAWSDSKKRSKKLGIQLSDMNGCGKIFSCYNT